MVNMDCFLSCPECVIGDSVCDCSNARVGNQIQGYNRNGLLTIDGFHMVSEICFQSHSAK